jgi:tetratricopeptide (TPR) repeat protein
MSTRAQPLPKILVVAVLGLTLIVLGLGGAVVAIRLRPEPLPTTAVERALAEWQRAVDEDPQSDIAQTGLGLALLDAGKPDAAREAFQTAAELNDANWMALFQLALLTRDTQPDQALSMLREAAKMAPQEERVAILIAQGDLLLEQGDAEGAGAAYRKSIIFNPFTFDGHFGLASALELQGDDRAALKEYREAERFAPGQEDVVAAIERLSGTS